MTNLDRVANEIKNVGLYDLILQDVQRILGKTKVSIEEIKELLVKEPQLLEDYKQTNVEYNLSNLHLKEIDTKELDGECESLAKSFNKKLKTLKEIEKYTLDFAHSSTLVIIFSVEFFVLFSVQYFIVLLNLKEYQWYIYGVFALSILIAWLYAKKVKKIYEVESKRFYKLYDEALEELAKLEEMGCVKKSDLWIMECEEHI